MFFPQIATGDLDTPRDGIEKDPEKAEQLAHIPRRTQRTTFNAAPGVSILPGVLPQGTIK